MTREPPRLVDRLPGGTQAEDLAAALIRSDATLPPMLPAALERIAGRLHAPRRRVFRFPPRGRQPLAIGALALAGLAALLLLRPRQPQGREESSGAVELGREAGSAPGPTPAPAAIESSHRG